LTPGTLPAHCLLNLIVAGKNIVDPNSQICYAS
jgi:hypothetical protein